MYTIYTLCYITCILYILSATSHVYYIYSLVQIQQIRAQTKAEKKRLAMAVREKHLSSIGMKTNKKGQVVVTSDLLKEADDLKEESGLICSICREGYHNQPSKVRTSWSSLVA